MSLTTDSTPTNQPSNPDLFNLLRATYLVLNASKPRLTRARLLSLDTRPHYYEEIATQGRYTSSPDTQSCRWQHSGRGRLTLQSVTGNSLCMGQTPPNYVDSAVKLSPLGTGNLILPDDTGWACTTGLTPCIHAQVLTDIQGFCLGAAGHKNSLFP